MTLMLWSFAALEYDIGARALREAMHVFLKGGVPGARSRDKDDSSIPRPFTPRL